MFKDRQAQFRAVAETSPAAIFIAEDDRLSYVNPILAALTEYDRKALIGIEVLQLLDASERAAAADWSRARLRGEPVEPRREVRIRTRTGRECWLDLTISPIVHEGGAAIVGTGVDITDRRLLEHRLRQRQQLEALGRLAGGVAHDFNNLLLVIGGETDRLLSGLGENDPLRASARAIERAAGRAVSLTESLLAFGRRQTLIARPVDVSQIVTELRQSLHEVAGKGIVTTLRLTWNLPPVLVDRARFEHVLLSLVSNARDAMAGAGRLTIATDLVTVDDEMRTGRPWLTDGKRVRVRVIDTGPGIPPEIMPRVFEPFFTTKGDRRSGLGLSTVYGIVKQSGGFVWIDSAPGDGACVTILLPPAMSAQPAAPGDRVLPADRPRVLLVDDEPDVRQLLMTVLERNDFDVRTASSAEEALEICATERFDVLLSDVLLPGMAGPDLASRVTRDAPDTRVLLMSGYTGDGAFDGSALGEHVEFLQKPFAAQMLVDRLRALIARGERSGRG